MKNKVRLNKNQLNYFRELARNSPNEILAYLIGEVINPNLTVIESFEYTPMYAISTPQAVAWSWADYDVIKQKAEERDKRVVGFIHSHPEWDAVLSPADYEIMITNGYRVCGICSTHDRRTRNRFWVMDTALPCAIEYAKKRQKQTKED